MAMMGLLPMAQRKLKDKGLNLGVLSPMAIALGEHKSKKKNMKGGGMNRANMNKQMGYMGGGKVMKYKKGGKIDGAAIRGKTRGRNR